MNRNFWIRGYPLFKFWIMGISPYSTWTWCRRRICRDFFCACADLSGFLRMRRFLKLWRHRFFFFWTLCLMSNKVLKNRSVTFCYIFCTETHLLIVVIPTVHTRGFLLTVVYFICISSSVYTFIFMLIEAHWDCSISLTLLKWELLLLIITKRTTSLSNPAQVMLHDWEIYLLLHDHVIIRQPSLPTNVTVSLCWYNFNKEKNVYAS